MSAASHRVTEGTAACADLAVVAGYLRQLDRALRGPERARADLLAEVRDSLLDAVEAYRQDGLDVARAQRRAVAEFGTVAELAPAYQDEIAAGASRTLALHTALAFAAVAGCSVLMWWGAPGSTAPRPPGYVLLAGWVDRLSYTLVALAALTYGWLVLTGRRGRTPGRGLARLVGAGAVLLMAATAVGGTLVYAWSVRLSAAMAAWPPTVIGSILLGSMYAWLGRAAWHCLLSGRRTTPAGTDPTVDRRVRPRRPAARDPGTGRPSS